MKYLVKQTFIFEMEVEANNEEEASLWVAELPWCEVCNHLKDDFPEPEVQEIQ